MAFNKSKAKKSFKKFNRPRPEFFEQLDRQQERWQDLIAQFDGCYEQLIGRGAALVLAGHKCTHTPDEFRPVHIEMPRWRNRPAWLILTVGADKMILSSAMSQHRDGKLHYMNGNGEYPCSFDFYQMPRKGARGEVMDGFLQHIMFTCGCNLLQELINTVHKPAGNFVLPRLMIMTNHVKIDEAKLDALAETVMPEMRDVYKQKRREEVGVYSLGQLFGDAELMRDDDIKDAFIEQRVYEDYRELLGAAHINPARKIFLANNPARVVLNEAGLPGDWACTADTALVDKLIKEMRSRLPLPERALDSDLIDALENPAAPVKFSVPVEKVPASAIVKAMRKTFPLGAAIGHAVTDEDLLAAVKRPYEPMIVRNYAKIQVFSQESMVLPNYATGTFFARPRASDLELA